MSRGPGTIQAYLITTVDSRKELIPIPMLALMYAKDHGVEYTPHLRSSFRRAAGKLVRAGNLKGWELQCPTRIFGDGTMGSYRWTLCVAPKWMEITPEDEHGAQVLMGLIGGS